MVGLESFKACGSRRRQNQGVRRGSRERSARTGERRTQKTLRAPMFGSTKEARK